jgi:nucleotide-binding universal stress UspA family protein
VTDEDRLQLRAHTVALTAIAPSEAIVQYAMTEDIDVIVMGTHGRNGLAHLFMGSVAERVVRLSPCPVLTVRHPQHEFIAPDALVAIAKA